jgi:anaerobic magnesium-protoporphyrin IX monomethyl ester cyclase
VCRTQGDIIRIALVTPPSVSHRTAEESLALGYLAAVLRRAGFETIIIDAWLENSTSVEIARKISIIPDLALIGISAYITSIDEVRNLIRSLRVDKGRNLFIICGGFGPTFHPLVFIDAGADAVLIGEGEEAILDLAMRIKAGARPDAPPIPGAVYASHPTATPALRSTQIPNLDTLPWPARDTIAYTINKKNPVHISTSRGCLAHCHFCSVIAFDKKMRQTSRWRQRSITNIVAEIRHIYEAHGARCFKIVDDSFIEPPRDESWAEEFAEELERNNLRISFRTQVRADRLSLPLVRALKSAGWFATSIGVENFSPSALRRMNKSAKVEHNWEALYLLESHRIYVQMGLILFDPKTTLPELHDNLRSLSRLAWPVTKGIFTEMYAAPDTPFTKGIIRAASVRGSKDGNYSYRLPDHNVEKVYEALREWQRARGTVYDQAINPLSAPKALVPGEYSHYHRICLELFRRDVEFLRFILTQV